MGFWDIFRRSKKFDDKSLVVDQDFIYSRLNTQFKIGKGKIIVAGVGMSFLDGYLGSYASGRPYHLVLFYDFIEELTGIDWAEHCKKDFFEKVVSQMEKTE